MCKKIISEEMVNDLVEISYMYERAKYGTKFMFEVSKILFHKKYGIELKDEWFD